MSLRGPEDKEKEDEVTVVVKGFSGREMVSVSVG